MVLLGEQRYKSWTGVYTSVVHPFKNYNQVDLRSNMGAMTKNQTSPVESFWHDQSNINVNKKCITPGLGTYFFFLV